MLRMRRDSGTLRMRNSAGLLKSCIAHVSKSSAMFVEERSHDIPGQYRGID